MARQKSPGRTASSRSQDDGRTGGGSRARPLAPQQDDIAASADAEAVRQAECAAMLIAVTRMLLNLRGRDFAIWLRSIADDFEATDPDHEDPEDLSDELIRMGAAGADCDEEAEAAEEVPPTGFRRPH
jgi:hypothetical protein